MAQCLLTTRIYPTPFIHGSKWHNGTQKAQNQLTEGYTVKLACPVASAVIDMAVHKPEEAHNETMV